MKNELISLLQKYDVALPRYTSYPTVPYWDFAGWNEAAWLESVRKTFVNENGEVCLYLHLPFCEELCTYCACNKRITKNHAVETPYLDSLLREWEMYRAQLPSAPVIREIHLGGGTPTFFSPANLSLLMQKLTEGCTIAPGHEFSVEVHPNYTTQAHLEALRQAGFNRISLGVQDFDPAVQFIINRIQTFEQTQQTIVAARALGFESVNIDLIYGLPRQTLQSIENTMLRVKELMPDRIAFYSYAHVPWKSKGQRRYTDEDVPKAAEKMAMYHRGNELLSQLGYESIGMDHFALPADKLMKAFSEGKLHRNFMGYTTTNHKLVIGLGASSISDTWTAFAQNEKTVEDYQQKIADGKFPVVNGHLLSANDLAVRRHILNLMCTGQSEYSEADYAPGHLEKIKAQLASFAGDRLVSLSGNTVTLLPEGRLFVRNVSAVFDVWLHRSQPQGALFSRAI